MGNVVRERRGDRRAVSIGLVGIAVAGLLLTGCGASARKDLDLNTMAVQDEARAAELRSLFEAPTEGWVYEIQAGDKLEVVFFTHPDQNRFVQVRPDGRITLPFAGEMVAAGRAPADVAADIQARFEEVLVKPRVDVLIQTPSAPIYVFGEVNRPGTITYERQLDIVQALASVGGHNDEARLSNLVVLRKGPNGAGAVAILNFRDYMANPSGPGNIQLRPHDVVWVPKDNITRWDDAVYKMFRGAQTAQDVALDTWSLFNFNEVYVQGNRRP